MKALLNRLKLPEVRQLALDAPESLQVHRRLIYGKTFLRRLYTEHYRGFLDLFAPPLNDKLLVEIGSGAGFIKELHPGVVTTDIVAGEGIDKICWAHQLPFADASVDGIFMQNVLHHLADARRFFDEVQRCLKPGGKLMMIEPANSLWHRLILKLYQHEPFDEKAGWELPPGGRLSQANVALPWIIFHRDRARFEADFPLLHIDTLRPHTPFIYILSGGLTFRPFLPSWSYTLVRTVEKMVMATPLKHGFGIFQTVVLSKSAR